MTEPQSGRPDSGRAGGMAPEGPPATQPRVPQQATRAAGQPGDQGGESRIDHVAGYDRRIGGLGIAIAGKAWMAALLSAVGMIAVGILLLAWPTATLTVVALLIGSALLVVGLSRLYDGVTANAESGGMRAADIVIGLLAIVAGLYCLKHHSLTVVVLALVVGAFWIIHGLGSLIVAATSRDTSGRGLRAVGGLFSIAAGAVVLFWPGLSLVLLLTILGAWLIFYGVVLAGLAFGLRRDVRAQRRAAKMAAA